MRHAPWRPVAASPKIRGLASAYPNLQGADRNFVETRPELAIEEARDAKFLEKLAYGLLWIFAFCMPWENALFIPSFGTVGRAAGLAVFVIGILAVLDSGRLRTPALPHLLMSLLVVWVGLTYFWSFAPGRTRIVAVTYLQLLTMVWLIWQFAQTRRRQILLLRAFVLGTMVSAVAIILPFLEGASVASGPYYGRYTAMNFNPVDIALILVLSLPISLYLAVCDERLRVRFWLYGAHMVLAVCAILLTASRGPLIAACGIVPLIPFAVSRFTVWQKTVGLAVVLLAGVAALSLVPQSSWSRIGTIGAEVTSGTLNERTMIWQSGWIVFGESPFLGAGAAAFAPTVQHSLGMPFDTVTEKGSGQPSAGELAAHNTFLSVLVEQGVVGFTLFLAMLLTLVLSTFRMPVMDRVFWLCVLLTWGIGVSGLTWEDRKPSWFIFAVLVAAAAARIPASTRNQRNARVGNLPSGRFPGPRSVRRFLPTTRHI